MHVSTSLASAKLPRAGLPATSEAGMCSVLSKDFTNTLVLEVSTADLATAIALAKDASHKQHQVHHVSGHIKLVHVSEMGIGFDIYSQGLGSILG